MSFGISVKGGTGAGRKRPLRERPIPWMCMCDTPTEAGVILTFQPGYLVRCPNCGAERDGGR